MYIILKDNENAQRVAQKIAKLDPPMSVLDSLGYDKGVFDELVKNGELLVIPDRCEVFITSYFVHNKGFKRSSWKASPFAVYWENKLYIKSNGIVDFAPEGLPKKELDPLDKIQVATNTQESVNSDDWDRIMDDIKNYKPDQE